MSDQSLTASGGPNRTLRVLLVEDDDDDAALVERTLRKSGRPIVLHRVDTAASYQAGLAKPQVGRCAL